MAKSSKLLQLPTQCPPSSAASTVTHTRNSTERSDAAAAVLQEGACETQERQPGAGYVKRWGSRRDARSTPWLSSPASTHAKSKGSRSSSHAVCADLGCVSRLLAHAIALA
mmetsp:Transcript_12702/g.29310  ORF Transcript_12702/g.29310 Transcript_12702/m.29310 type:complete len:111 (-) Transcript_12702:1098-1430(-)